MYNPDYIDDRECREARRIEREVMADLAFRISHEIRETTALSERMRQLSQRIMQHHPKHDHTSIVNSPANINVLSELGSYKPSTFQGRL